MDFPAEAKSLRLWWIQVSLLRLFGLVFVDGIELRIFGDSLIADDLMESMAWITGTLHGLSYVMLLIGST